MTLIAGQLVTDAFGYDEDGQYRFVIRDDCHDVEQTYAEALANLAKLDYPWELGDVHGLRRWFALTFLMGLTFVLGQANEYRHLVSEGIKINGDGYGSMFYLTTGFHGLHVTGGLIAFILFLIRTTMGRFTPAQATAAIVVSYYWHFVDVVWIALFAMIYFLQ